MTDLVSQLVGALERLSAQCERMRLPGQPMSDAEKNAIAALTAAKAGGWLPIEQASDAEKHLCWVLVGASVHLAAYIVIGFEEERDLDGRYVDQVDHDEYWMDIDSGDALEPTHYQPLVRPLPTPPKEQSAGGLGSVDAVANPLSPT